MASRQVTRPASFSGLCVARRRPTSPCAWMGGVRTLVPCATVRVPPACAAARRQGPRAIYGVSSMPARRRRRTGGSVREGERLCSKFAVREAQAGQMREPPPGSGFLSLPLHSIPFYRARAVSLEVYVCFVCEVGASCRHAVEHHLCIVSFCSATLHSIARRKGEKKGKGAHWASRK